MTDIVNTFFKQHYPADSDTAWEMEYCVESYAKSYKGTTTTIFPYLYCADGFRMSVQGHFGAYSQPRDDFADRYSSVEIMCPADPLLDEHGGHECGDKILYGYVPIALVEKVVETHGGLAATPAQSSKGK